MTLTGASIIWLAESELSLHHKEYRHYHHYPSDIYDSLSFLLSGVGDCWPPLQIVPDLVLV
jgi:hypothetical protein